MSKLRLSLACWNYDRTRALLDGSVQPDGIDLVYLDMPVEETFFRMLRNREFDVAELSLSSYTVSLFREPKPFIAIPVGRRGSSGIRRSTSTRKSGIAKPGDLAGRRIGNPEYQMTAPVWIRGILQDEYAVPVDSVDLCHRRRGGARPRREAEARSARQHQGGADRTCADVVAQCWRRARSPRCRPRECRRPLPCPARTASGACSRTIRKSRRTISDGTKYLSDHAHGRDPT